MSEELKRELGSIEEVVEVPLTGLTLYNSFKKSLPKGLTKDTVALRWVEYKIMLGLPIIEKKIKEPKEKKEKVVKFKIVKPKKEKIVKKKVLDENNNMIGDYNLDIIIPDIPIIPQVVEVC